jgi:cytochrome P450
VLRLGTPLSTLLTLHKKYGKVVRIGPNDLSWIDEVALRDVWAHRQGHQEFMKDHLFRTISPDGVYGILGADREDHARYRRLLSHAFSDKGMREQQGLIAGYVDDLVEGLKRASKEGESLNMVEWFNWTTFDVIGRLAFGEDFGCLRNGKMHPWIQAVFGNLKIGVFMTCFKRLGLAWVLPYLATEKAMAARKFNHEYTVEKVARRIEKGTTEGDFFDNVLKFNGQEKGMSVAELRANASHLILAGSETTATLLSGCIWELLQNPEALKKVTAEVREAFDGSEDINLQSTVQLKYTLAVLDETMRIYPPVPSQAPRTVPAGGDTINGEFIPEGTKIHLPQYVAFHLESNFTRPDEFHPERFLGAEEFAHDNYAIMQPFSVGSRNCIGRNLAYAEMRLILAKILYNFDLELDEKTGDWTDQKVFILWEKHPLLVKLKAVR